MATSADTTTPDGDLVALIAQGDRAALETVFNQYGGAVKSLANRVLRNETLAEDTVQEVFVGLWKNPERFDSSRGTLRTFLMTLAHRRAVDAIRSEQARTNREERVLADAPGSIDDQVWSQVLSGTVREAVSNLQEGEREAIELAYFGGLSYVEVAKKLGLPEGTVKSRIRAAMRKLGSDLESLRP